MAGSFGLICRKKKKKTKAVDDPKRGWAAVTLNKFLEVQNSSGVSLKEAEVKSTG